ncbi:Conserved_hypothetical protein [Hexamita inflata]|uniref:Transmembrane protein n=1 Tax=Hexamita inflata TaxID=28002 RepID=A0AA86U1X8_9EUKA|nr:Conserved hypothetical protein [Hexamita inflata]
MGQVCQNTIEPEGQELKFQDNFMNVPFYYQAVICKGQIYIQCYEKIYKLQKQKLVFVDNIPDLNVNDVQSFHGRMFSSNDLLYVHNGKTQMYILLNDQFKQIHITQRKLNIRTIICNSVINFLIGLRLVKKLNYIIQTVNLKGFIRLIYYIMTLQLQVGQFSQSTQIIFCQFIHQLDNVVNLIVLLIFGIIWISADQDCNFQKKYWKKCLANNRFYNSIQNKKIIQTIKLIILTTLMKLIYI